MSKLIKTAATLMMICCCAVVINAQNTTGQGPGTGYASPFHAAKIHIFLPDNTPEGSILNVYAKWTVLYTTMTPPDEGFTADIYQGQTQVHSTLYCATDARPQKISLCGSLWNSVTEKFLYFSVTALIDQNSGWTDIYIQPDDWTTARCNTDIYGPIITDP